jgi:hypothetical protein
VELLGAKLESIRANSVNKVELLYSLLLLCILLGVLLLIEYHHPYFFLQDDNRDSYLPYFIHNYKSLLSGELAFYNFHQFLGHPSLATGQAATLYPITYLSVFLSNLIFGHYFAAVDIQVIIHLMIGALGSYKFIKFLGCDSKAALFAGLTWSLSSFIVYASDSWLIVATVAACFPWMLLFSFRIYKVPSLRTNIYAVLIRLCLVYSGQMQYLIYSVIFEFLTTLLYVLYGSLPAEKRANTFRFLKTYIEGYTYVFILSLPLLLPMWHLTSASAQRSDKLPFAVYFSQYFPTDQLLKGLFYPFLQVNETIYASWRNMINLSHIGYLPLFIIAIGLIERVLVKSTKKNSVKLSVFMWPALIAFLWSTNFVFNLVVYGIPMLNRFRWPFKLIFYFDFYLIIIAALLLSHIIMRVTWKETTKRILFYIILGLQIFNFVFLYTEMPYKAFGERHADNLPLVEKFQSELINGRIISLGFDTWTPTPGSNHEYLTAPTLGFNYATLWGLDYFAGYNILLPLDKMKATLGLNFVAIIPSDKPIPVEYLRKAAVKWYIVPIFKADEYATKFSLHGIAKKYEDENRAIFYDSKAYPMVFNSKGESIEDYQTKTNSIEVITNYQQDELISFNYMYDSFFEGFIDGEKTNLTPTSDIHFTISVPQGKHQILIKYKDPYFIAGIYAVAAFLMLIIIRVILRRRRFFAKVKEERN